MQTRHSGGCSPSISILINAIFLSFLVHCARSDKPTKIWYATQIPQRGIFCSPYNNDHRISFRRVQNKIQEIGWQSVFSFWDGIDDSVPNNVLSWVELRLGFRTLEMYNAWGNRVKLSENEINLLVREFSDDTTEDFRSSRWGSSFYSTDGNDQSILLQHNAGRPQNQADGGSDNAMCRTVAGMDLGFCERVSQERFRSAVYQIADLKYAESCNGHGTCDPSLAFCLCDSGWTGLNCSEPEKPCAGVKILRDSHGSFSPGFGRDRSYGYNLNCTWRIMPTAAEKYGLPMMLVFSFIKTEDAYDTIQVYGNTWTDPNNAVISLDGTFPKISSLLNVGQSYGMPQSLNVYSDAGVTVNFKTDATISLAGFRLHFDTPLSDPMFRFLHHPLLAPGCQRKLGDNSSSCYDSQCSNCGLTFNERADGATNGNILDNMCYDSIRQSTESTTVTAGGYQACSDVFPPGIQHVAGDTVTLTTNCPSGTSFTSTESVDLDTPEYILGPGPPEYRIRRPREGQASQRGYIVPDWWSTCDDVCDNYRVNRRYDLVYSDEPGLPGPIFAGQLAAMKSSVASTLYGAWETFPPLLYTNLQYGYPQGSKDIRTDSEKNSFALRNKYNATFRRCRKSTDPSCPIGRETCSVSFTPTIPGVYVVRFFKLQKQLRIDTFMQAIPFPQGNDQRSVVIMPGITSPDNSVAYGSGLDYGFTTRAGDVAHFWIDSLDNYGNPRLVGGDQYLVILVAQSRNSIVLADVTNLGNGSYLVGYNITASGRYSLNIVMKYGTSTSIGEALCKTPSAIHFPDQTLFDGGSLWCHVGSERLSYFAETRGRLWCPPESTDCISYSLTTPHGLPPIRPASPYSVFVGTGPLGADTIQSFGNGLVRAVAGFPALFYLRIRDIFGNWAFTNENISFAFDVPLVDQKLPNNDTSPQTAAARFVGDENWLGDYVVEWFPVIPGDYNISVLLCTPFCWHIAGSPFKPKVVPSPTYGPESIVHGSGILDGEAGTLRVAFIQDRDVMGNNRTVGGENFAMILSGLSLADCPQIQASVLRDVSCKCEGLFQENIQKCKTIPQQMQPGSELSMNIPPELTCLYQRNRIECPTNCCPQGVKDGCSSYSLPPTVGKSAVTSLCETRTCASLEQCKVVSKASRQVQTLQNSLFRTFLESSRNGCPQLERLGLESGFLLPPDDGGGTYFLIIQNLDPNRPSWRGPMLPEEVQAWIAKNDLATLYYTKAQNAKGYYFSKYGPAAQNKSFIEGFVWEEINVLGRRESRTSTGPRIVGADLEFPTMIGAMEIVDKGDGTYIFSYNVTRAGLYRLAITHRALQVFDSPFNFFVEPGPFEPTTCIVNGTGASIDTDVHTGESDYRAAIVAGKFVYMDIRLRDKFWNYLWSSLPSTKFRVSLDPMLVRYFDTTQIQEKQVSWSASFGTFSLQDYGDADYTVDYMITTAGNFPMNVKLLSSAGTAEHLGKSPYMISVRPDVVDVPSSTAFGLGVFSCGSGTICSFGVETRDRWGNRRVLQEDEGPWCHAWSSTVNDGGSGGNHYAAVYDPQGCSTPNSCLLNWNRWSNTQPATFPIFDSTQSPYPAESNAIAYQARGGLLHDCVPSEPFSDPLMYNQKPSCSTSRMGPCGQYDKYGRQNQAFWAGPDGKNYTWSEYRAKFPDRRGKYFVLIPNAQPVEAQNFSCYIDENNFYSCTYNITFAGTYEISVVYQQGNTLYHVSGSPFPVTVSGGITTPPTCIVTGEGAFAAQIGYPATFTVHARDRFKNFRTLGREKVEVVIQGAWIVRPIPVRILDLVNGKYYVEYNATLSGTYAMSVSILDQDIPGSPFQIVVSKGFKFPHFNTTWGLSFAGSANPHILQGQLQCFDGKTGCVSAIQLTSNQKNSTGAVWYNTKQRLDLGFETQFCFSMDSELEQHCQTPVVESANCMYRGGDGLAFVIHDNGFHSALGANGGDLGYGGIDNSLAVEFDTWYNAILGDIYQNHVAVHTMGKALNTPHASSRISSTSNVPALADKNRHCAKIRYQPWIDNEALSDGSYSSSAYGAQYLTTGSGLLQVWVDDFTLPVLTTPINLNTTLGLEEGMAWVGFTASTGIASQHHFVYSWSLVPGVCRSDCNSRGSCIEGICYCQSEFYGPDCGKVVMIQNHADLGLCSSLDPGQSASPTQQGCYCAPGSSGPVGGPCYACPPNSFKPVAGPSPCIPCPPNSDTNRNAGMKLQADCKCKAGYIGPDGGACQSAPEDTYKISSGLYPNTVIACPSNSGTHNQNAKTSKLDCLCKPGYSGPNGGPCLPCPSDSWKSSWGSASCDSACLPNSATFGCQGNGGNTACTSYFQCVCVDGYYGIPCLPGSLQALANKTCVPCVQSRHGPIKESFQDRKLQKTYTIDRADQREDPDYIPTTIKLNNPNL